MLIEFLKLPQHRALLVLLTAALIEMTGYFMLGPMLVLSLNANGVPHSVIGVFSAMSWLSLLLSAPFAAMIVQRLGQQNTLRFCAVVPLACGIAYSLSSAVCLWFIIAFLGGLSSSLRWICSEATVAALANDHTRARWVSAYSTTIGLTFMMGPASLSFWVGNQSSGTQLGQLPWLISLGLIATGAALTFLIRLPNHLKTPSKDSHTLVLDLLRLAKHSPLLLIAGMVGGFFEVGLNGVLPLYGLSLGWHAAQATMLVSVSAAGGILGVLATGWLASYGSRQQQMVWFAGAIVVACCAQYWVPSAAMLAWAIVAVWGFAGAALYILIMVDIGSRLTGAALIQSTALLVMAYTLGGLLAPALGGLFLQLKQQALWPAFEALTTFCAILGWMGVLLSLHLHHQTIASIKDH